LDLDAAPPAGWFGELAGRLWNLLSAPEQRALVRLTYEAFLRSVSRDPGPWQGYAAETARDWLDLLVRAQPETPRALAEARATRALALIRGLLLDLLTSDDRSASRQRCMRVTGLPNREPENSNRPRDLEELGGAGS